MAEIFKVNIELGVATDKLLYIPEEIKVPQNSIVQWNIVGLDPLFYELIYNRGGLIFTIYFSEKSPFRWKTQFVQLFNERPFRPYKNHRIIRLAEEVADEKGDFKYGVKVEEGGSGEELYDEDPRLIVY